jgi:phage terminase large subunit
VPEIEARVPPKLEPLFQTHRYKVAYGGRGGAKSWGFARALLIEGAQKPLRILCTREVQKSIKDSVHKLLCDQIQSLELGKFYTPTQNNIVGLNGTEFIFSGLSDQTRESIKSYEGVDRCWVEEGQAVGKRSWDILTPTIRKTGSQIWISFNPHLDTDETWLRFVVHTPPNSWVQKINWQDNPWFSPELEAERSHAEKTDPENYKNIWEGEPRAAVEGAIFSREVTKLTEDKRITRLPIDPLLKVHTVWDIGWNDKTAIILVQRGVADVRIVDYIEDSHRTLQDYAAQLNDMRLNWGSDWLPHDAKAKNVQTGKSPEEMLMKLRPSIRAVPNIDMESGIKAARILFAKAYFDQDKAVRLLECLKRYRRVIHATTNEPGAPLHDEYSHGADAWRYLAIVVDQMRNESKLPPLPKTGFA